MFLKKVSFGVGVKEQCFFPNMLLDELRITVLIMRERARLSSKEEKNPRALVAVNPCSCADSHHLRTWFVLKKLIPSFKK